jgi:hypothetical protein
MLNQLLLFCALITFGGSYSQDSNEESYQKGIDFLENGYTENAHKTFLELSKKDINNKLYKSYLSYSYTKICLFKDSVSDNELNKAAELAKNVYKEDSTLHSNQYAYASSLFLSYKNSSSKKEKAKLLVKIKSLLDKIITSKSVTADIYNLTAIWHRTVAKFDRFELEMMETFYGGAPKGGSFATALEMHKKAFKLKEHVQYKYELAITYKAMDIESLYINTLNEGVDIHGESTDDIFFSNKCEEKLPSLSE